MHIDNIESVVVWEWNVPHELMCWVLDPHLVIDTILGGRNCRLWGPPGVSVTRGGAVFEVQLGLRELSLSASWLPWSKLLCFITCPFPMKLCLMCPRKSVLQRERKMGHLSTCTCSNLVLMSTYVLTKLNLFKERGTPDPQDSRTSILPRLTPTGPGDNLTQAARDPTGRAFSFHHPTA